MLPLFSLVLPRNLRARATTEKISICPKTTISLFPKSQKLMQTPLLCLQAVLLFIFRGLMKLRVSLTPDSAVRQAAAPLQIFLPAQLTPAVKRQKHILLSMKITPPSAIIPAALLFQNIKKAFISDTDIMTQPKKRFFSRLATVFPTQHLNTAI